MANTKSCNKCGEEKLLTDFSPHKHGKFGRQSRCKKCCNEANKKWYHNNIDFARKCARIASKTFSENHPRRRAKLRKAWFDNNPDKMKQARLNWIAANPEKMKAARKAWYDKNREAWRVYLIRYRSRQKENGGKFTVEDIDRMLIEQDNSCKICGIFLDLYHIDHIVPVCKGGTSDPRNLQLLCPPCNRWKSSRDMQFLDINERRKTK